MLGFVVEAIAGERLDQFVSRTIYRRLGLRNTLFCLGETGGGASLPPRTTRRAAIRCGAKFTTKPRTRSVVSRVMRGCSRRQPISPCSRR